MSATTNLGKVSVTPKGAWAITNAYEILDIVTSGGSSYLAKQDVPTGVSLSNTSYWIMIAEKGDGGEVTSASASISGGYGTPGVSVTAGGTAHERTLAFAFTNLRGEKGETGNGIDSVYKTGTSGLVDTYTILFTDGSTYEFEVNNGTASIDNTLTKSGWAADAKVVGDTKASIDGFYETMGVGVADNLTPYSEDSGATQDIPFIAQGTGCGNGESVVDTGSYLQFKKKLGNTVGVNQLLTKYSGSDGTYNGITITNTITGRHFSGTATANTTGQLDASAIPFKANHIYLVRGITGGSSSTYYMATSGSTSYGYGASKYNPYLLTPTVSSSEHLRVTVVSGATVDFEAIGQVIDLTLWFGSNDRIPSDLLSHPENWGRYYAGSLAYNAGTLESADGTVMKSIGRNMLNKANFVKGRVDNGVIGYASATTALSETATGISFTTNAGYRGVVSEPIRVSPNTQVWMYLSSTAWVVGICDAYDASGNWIGTCQRNTQTQTLAKYTAYFDVPAGTATIRFSIQEQAAGTVEVNDITISLYYPGESGYDQYYPFSVLAEVDTGSEVLRSAGSVADEKTPDGTITRRVGYVNLGTLGWSRNTSGTYPVFIATLSDSPSSIAAGFINIQCAKYEAIGATSLTAFQGTDYDKKICHRNNNTTILVQDSSILTADAFITAMSGVYLYYELATPTTEQGTAFAENIPCDDFGSMYWTQTKGIPQGNEIFYPVDYKASIDTLYNRVEGDMGAIVIDSQLEVVADRIPEAPSEDGTYTLKATVSSGTKTYSWVADE